MYRLPGELKDTKMHVQTLLGFEAHVCVDRFCWIQMDIFHEPVGLVCADREYAERKGTKALTLLLGERRKAGIPAQVDVSLARLYDWGTAQDSCLIEDVSR